MIDGLILKAAAEKQTNTVFNYPLCERAWLSQYGACHFTSAARVPVKVAENNEWDQVWGKKVTSRSNKQQCKCSNKSLMVGHTEIRTLFHKFAGKQMEITWRNNQQTNGTKEQKLRHKNKWRLWSLSLAMLHPIYGVWSISKMNSVRKFCQEQKSLLSLVEISAISVQNVKKFLHSYSSNAR